MEIDYSLVAHKANGDYVHENVFGDLMNIQRDGYPTIEAAEADAPGMFGRHPDIAYVVVRESIQEFPGGSWRAGPVVKRVHRSDGAHGEMQ